MAARRPATAGVAAVRAETPPRTAARGCEYAATLCAQATKIEIAEIARIVALIRALCGQFWLFYFY